MAIVDIVKYEGSPDVLAWKYPQSELSTWTQVIVNESQDAVLFKGGQALDVFSSGRHVLETDNIPILNKIINLPFGGRSPFQAEVWFVNKLHSLDIKWGTLSPIQLLDPKYKIMIPVRSFGQFGIQINNSKQFLTKLVGTLPVFDKEHLTNHFRGLTLTTVKDTISQYMIRNQIGVLEINAYIEELSKYIGEKMTPVMDEYGIRLLNFYATDISLPEDATDVQKLREALSKKAEMDIVGFNYSQEKSFEALEGAAANPGTVGGMMGAGLGLGMGVGVGGAFGKQINEITGVIEAKEGAASLCPHCGKPVLQNAKFCHECGGSVRVECPECGREASGFKFCPDCGTKMGG